VARLEPAAHAGRVETRAVPTIRDGERIGIGVNSERSGVRERVRQAIAGPVAEAEKLLAEPQDADADTRTSILVIGWFRGLADALEESSIAVDDLFAQLAPETAIAAPPPEESEGTPSPSTPQQSSERVGLSEADEKELSEMARESRKETARLRQEAKRARRRLEH